MNQEELKDFILSKITLNKEFWSPKIEAFFKENPNITRKSMYAFFEESIGIMRRETRVLQDAFFKKEFGENYLRDTAIEVLTSDLEARLFDNYRRKNGLIPIEEVALAREEVDIALYEAGVNEKSQM